MCIKSLNNAQLQKDHFGQKMTSDNTQQDIFGSQAHFFRFRQNRKNLNNARLQKDHFGQKMTLDNTQKDIFGSQAYIFEISSK